MPKRILSIIGGLGIVAIGVALIWFGFHQFEVLAAAEAAGSTPSVSPKIAKLVYLALGKWGVLVGFILAGLVCLIHGGAKAWDNARDEAAAS